MLETTKKGQGLVVRRVAFWSLLILIVWGGQSLYTWLLGFEFAKDLVLGGDPTDGELIPVLNQKFDYAFVISWGVVILSGFILHRFLNRPKPADFLIETDNEVKKVTWPSWKDARQSAIIVVVFVAALTLFLMISDWLLSRGISIVL